MWCFLVLPMRGAVARLLVVACVRGAQPASRLRVPPCNYTDPSTGPTRKTAFSRDRLIYVAGLEHTGHHLWHQGIWPRLGLRVRCARWTSLTVHRRSDVLKNACEGHGVDEGNLSTALLQDERSGVRFVKACSYPCAHAHRNPDVANLARVAEKVGVDARLVVTTRRAGPETKIVNKTSI